MTARKRQGPLDGLRVVDCSGMIAGGFATTQLADFGADVIKVEHPEGTDPLREWPPYDEGVSLWWKSIARNKRCVTLDLSTPEGSALLLDLIDDADVLVENFRPGTMEKWGLGPDRLHEENPGLIVVRQSGYGQTGPRSDKPGFGTVAEGISNWAHVNGFPDSKPLLPPISLGDLTAANFAVQGVMFALFERDVGRGGGSGEGQVIDMSLYEPLFRLFVSEVEAYDRLGEVRERIGNHHESAAPRNVYETEDGYMTLSASKQLRPLRSAESFGVPEKWRGVRWFDVRGEVPEGIRSAYNDREIQGVLWLLGKWFEEGLLGDPDLSVGVVTPFRAQTDRLEQRMKEAPWWEKLQSPSESDPSVEVEGPTVGTAHRFQGDERDLMIFSPVVAPGIDEFTERWVATTDQLLNVAVTRARASLQVVGHLGRCRGAGGSLAPFAEYVSEKSLVEGKRVSAPS